MNQQRLGLEPNPKANKAIAVGLSGAIVVVVPTVAAAAVIVSTALAWVVPKSG